VGIGDNSVVSAVNVVVSRVYPENLMIAGNLAKAVKKNLI
jgi:serine acetyltransferase